MKRNLSASGQSAWLPYGDESFTETSDTEHDEVDLKIKMASRAKLNKQYVSKYCYVVGIKNNIPKIFQDYKTCPDDLWVQYEEKVRAFLFDFHREANEYKIANGELPKYYQDSSDPQDQHPSSCLPVFLEPLTSSTPLSWGGYNRKCYKTPPRKTINEPTHEEDITPTPMVLAADCTSLSSLAVPDSSPAASVSSSSSLESNSSFLPSPSPTPVLYGDAAWEFAGTSSRPPAKQLHAFTTARRNKKTGHLQCYDEPKPVFSRSHPRPYDYSKPLCSSSDQHYPSQRKPLSLSSTFLPTQRGSYQTSYRNTNHQTYSQQSHSYERSSILPSSSCSTNQTRASSYTSLQQKSPVLSSSQCSPSQESHQESQEKSSISTSSTSTIQSVVPNLSSSVPSSSAVAPVIHNHYNFYVIDPKMLSQLQSNNFTLSDKIGTLLNPKQKSEKQILRKRRYNQRRRKKANEKAEKEGREKEKEKESNDEEQ